MKIFVKYVCVVGIVLVSIWSVFNAVWRSEERLYILAEENVVPYTFIEDGQMKGIDYDIVMEAAKRMNIKTTIEFVPWNQMQSEVQHGSCDAGMTLFYVKDREDFGIYAFPPLHYITYMVFVRKGHEFPFASIEDLYGKTVGKVRGHSISDEFDQAVAEGNITVEEVTTNLTNIKKVEAGRLDCMVGYLDRTLMELKREGLTDDLVPLPTPVQEAKGAHVVFSKNGKNIADKDAFVAQFNAVLEGMTQDGTFQKIYDSYLK
jgi:polar amino acid transport system substrate-binding protein